MSCLSAVCLSVHPHRTTRLPLDQFSWNLIFEDFLKMSGMSLSNNWVTMCPKFLLKQSSVLKFKKCENHQIIKFENWRLFKQIDFIVTSGVRNVCKLYNLKPCDWIFIQFTNNNKVLPERDLFQNKLPLPMFYILYFFHLIMTFKVKTCCELL